MSSRRNFLKQLSGAALAVGAAPSVLSWATSAQSGSIDIPGEDGMIVRSFRFVDLETPVEYLNTWLTPIPHFFVRNHMHEPSELNAESWRLTVGGEVEKSPALILTELSKLETHSVVNTLECAGNGRRLHRPQVPGIQWSKGAVGTARFSGPRLRDVLQRTGVKTTGKHVMFRGLDEVPGNTFATVPMAVFKSEPLLASSVCHSTLLSDISTIVIFVGYCRQGCQDDNYGVICRTCGNWTKTRTTRLPAFRFALVAGSCHKSRSRRRESAAPWGRWSVFF